MVVAVHALLFLFSAAVLWFFAGILIEATDAVAKRFNRSGFTVAFFLLGFLTSIGEFSVMVNSSVNGVPEVAVGNIIGASFIILLFIVPLLAVVGKGVHLKNTLNKKQLALALFVVSLPVLFVLDGNVRVGEGVVSLLAYFTLFYFIQEGRWWWRHHSNSVPEIIEEVEEELIDKRHATRVDLIKIIGGAIAIFLAGDLLVEEAAYFSNLLAIPGSVIGLVLLSVGTNIPEIVIALRAIRKGNVDIAFGDYLGSAVSNTVIFSILVLLNGFFVVEVGGFYVTALLMVVGLTLFFVFSHSRNEISPREGLVLVGIYLLFLLSQFTSVWWLLGH